MNLSILIGQFQGETTIAVTVDDGTNTATDTFLLIVVNDRPTISDIPDQEIEVNTSTEAIEFTVSDEETVEAEAPGKVELDEIRGRVETAMGLLAERDREVLLLWSAGNSYEDIARVTSLAAGAIGTTLARARKRLLEAYEGLEKDAARNRG